MKYIYLILGVLIAFTSCKKEEIEPTPILKVSIYLPNTELETVAVDFHNNRKTNIGTYTINRGVGAPIFNKENNIKIPVFADSLEIEISRKDTFYFECWHANDSTFKTKANITIKFEDQIFKEKLTHIKTYFEIMHNGSIWVQKNKRYENSSIFQE